jgi:ATP-dependent Clp protease, protease subunit
VKAKAMLNELLSKHTKQTAERIAEDSERDRFMSPEEAEAYGLVDKVIADKSAFKPGADEKDKG